MKREERLKRAAEAIDVLAEEFIAHPSTCDWLAKKMSGKCRAIAEELARRAPSHVEEVTRHSTEQSRLRRAQGVPTDSRNEVEENKDTSFTAISLHEADRKHYAVKYAAMKARVFGAAAPSAEGLQLYLDSLHPAAESGDAKEKSLICKTVNFWKDELGVEFENSQGSRNKKANPVVCTITFKSDSGNGAYRLCSADKNQTDLYSKVKFPRLRLSSLEGTSKETSQNSDVTEARSPNLPAKVVKRLLTNKEILQGASVRDEFARRLREARNKLGISTTELAAAAGMHQPSITRYEKARRLPHPDQLARLAAALGIAPMDLLPDSWRKSGKE